MSDDIVWDQPDHSGIVWDKPKSNATAQDRAQAAAAGVNRGVLAGIPGLPVDTLLNVWDLIKSGAGTVGKATGALSTEQMPQVTDRASIPGSSEWIANLFPDKTVKPNAPDDTASRVLFAGGQGVGGSLVGARTVGGMAAGGASGGLAQGAQEAGVGPSGQVLASLVPGAAPAVRQAIPTAQPRPMTPREQIIAKAQDAGFAFPPSLVEEQNPGLVNSALEKFAGKAATAQGASVKNRNLTQDFVKRDLGIPDDVPLTKEALQDVRATAGAQGYEPVKATGVVTPGDSYNAALDAIIAPYTKAAQGFPNAKPNPVVEQVNSLRTPAFDAASGIAKISELREQSQAAYASGDKVTGKALKASADAIENAIEQHLQDIGQPQLLDAYRDARRTIAKTYTAESAINPTTGDIDATKLIKPLSKGRLDGGMQTVAQIAAAAGPAMSVKPGAPGVSKLDATMSAGSILAAIASGNPHLALGALAPMGSSLARKAILSGPYQRVMVKPDLGGPGLLSDLAKNLLAEDQGGLLGALSVTGR